MKCFGWIPQCSVVAIGLLFGGRLEAATNSSPDFREVYDLIRAHVAGADDTALNRAALQGLLTAFGPKVQLGTNVDAGGTRGAERLVAKAEVLDDSVAYLRITRVSDGLDREVLAAWQHLVATNKLKGVVLDLRYSAGSDYSGAVAVADLFTAKAQPLLNFGGGMMSSRDKTNAIRLPVAVLVNSDTSGSAEALAAMLRETGAGLILGGRTAGNAMMMENFPLRNGDQLRIATVPIRLGDGTSLSSKGLEPDIGVTVSREEERAYYADPYGARLASAAGAKGASTNRVASADPGSRRGYMNEAELVREHKLGLDAEEGPVDGSDPLRRSEPSGRIVKDPALSRAMDLLKGLAVVRQDRL